MGNRINLGMGKVLSGMDMGKPSTPEMQTVEGLQCKLVELQNKGEKIIMEATDEIQKRNACLQEGLRVIALCRAYIKGKRLCLPKEDEGEEDGLIAQIDRWAGEPRRGA